MKKVSRQQRIVDYFNEQEGMCAYCGTEMTLDLGHPNTAEVEHIIPKSVLHIKGPYNEVAACHDCNQFKGDKPLREVIRTLQKSGEGVQSNQQELEFEVR